VRNGFVTLPMLYIAGGALALAVLVGGYFKLTADARAEGYAKARAECEEAARLQREAEMGKANLAATDLEKGNAKARVVYRTITREVDKIVERPVYRNVCLDDDGLRRANAALAEAGAAAAEPDSRVPQPLPIVGRDGGGGPAEAGRGR
jgi:hypothetical protein